MWFLRIPQQPLGERSPMSIRMNQVMVVRVIHTLLLEVVIIVENFIYIIVEHI
jgi:hypothetical protein